MKKIEGLIAAAFTPFNEDGSLHLDKIPALVDKLVNDGLKGIFVNGSNGEGPNMTTKERMLVAEEFVSAAAGRLLIFVHVGHSSISECRLLAAHAATIGADAISSVAAFYFKVTDVGNLVNCMADIASAAPGLPFFYYHIPHLTGMDIDMLRFLALAEKEIPSLAGIKYTASTIHEYQSCLNYREGRFDILFGFDELLLPAISVGARGAIGSTYTFAAPLFLQMKTLFEERQMEDARRHHAFLVEMIRIFAKYPSIPAQKAIMKMLGWDFGPCRLPLVTFNQQQYDQLKAELENIGFFEKIPPVTVLL